MAIRKARIYNGASGPEGEPLSTVLGFSSSHDDLDVEALALDLASSGLTEIIGEPFFRQVFFTSQEELDAHVRDPRIPDGSTSDWHIEVTPPLPDPVPANAIPVLRALLAWHIDTGNDMGALIDNRHEQPGDKWMGGTLVLYW